MERELTAQIPPAPIEIIIVAVFYTQQGVHLTLMVLLVFMLLFFCRCLCVLVKSCRPILSVCIDKSSNIDVYAKTVDSLLE
jgi:hypothetical protein